MQSSRQVQPGTPENTRDCLWGGCERVRGDWGGIGQGDVMGGLMGVDGR